MKQWRWFYITL